MDEVVVRRVVGVITLALAAFLLSWLLPRPGLERLRGESERVVTMDLTQPDSRPEEAGTATPDEEGDRGVATPVTEIVADEPLAPPTGPGQERSGRSVAPAPVPPVAAQDPAPPRPPADPVEVIALPKPGPAPKPMPKSEPKPGPKPELKPEPQPAPETKPPAVLPPPAMPETEARPATTAPSPGGKVFVRAGAYSFLEKAEGVRKRAALLGVICFVSPTETPKGTLYGLRCGPFADRDKADAAVKALTADGIAAQRIGGG